MSLPEPPANASAHRVWSVPSQEALELWARQISAYRDMSSELAEHHPDNPLPDHEVWLKVFLARCSFGTKSLVTSLNDADFALREYRKRFVDKFA